MKPEEKLYHHPSVDVQNHLETGRENRHFHFCTSITCLRFAGVLLLRTGYLLIQVGSIPVNDVYVVVLQNIVDVSTTLLAYGILGYMFSFGQDSLGGFIGTNSLFYTRPANLDDIVFGFCACLIGTATITTMMSGRTLALTTGGTSFIYSGLVLPLVMHWAWHEKGWMARTKISALRFSIKDHSGGIVVHLTSGTVALTASLCLGRRLIKLKEIHESSLGAESPTSSFIGYTFILLGLISFSLPTQNYEMNHLPDDFIGVILVNSILALSAGIFVPIMECCCFGRTSGYWILLKCLEGSVAGMVAVASGIDVYNHLVAFSIAAVAVILFYLVQLVSDRMFYEDYCNLVPIHICCAIFGAICAPLLGNKENLGLTIPFKVRFQHTLWQLTCCIAVMTTAVVVFLPFFIFLHYTGLLRNKEEELNHQRSINTCKNIGRNSGLWRIFTIAEDDSVQPGQETRSQTLLDKRLKKRYEMRRILLKTAFNKKKKKEKRKNALDELAKLQTVPEQLLKRDILEEPFLQKHKRTNKKNRHQVFSTNVQNDPLKTESKSGSSNVKNANVTRKNQKVIKAEVHNNPTSNKKSKK